ncbi:MAG TPA: alpha/beta hydrolase domain-containing protein, partial [Acidimicrobiia bacterium]|nr:alpha/beta hydrolase domain-containing protein [Acidimicrobiia bacterium]
MKTIERRGAMSRRGLRGAAIVCVALLGATACSSSKSAGHSAVTTTTQPRPPGPTANVSREIAGGKGVHIGSATPANVQKVGYVEHEYVAAGSATSYKVNGTITHNGRWRFVHDAT